MAVEAVDLLYRPLELLLTPENMSAASEVVLPKSNSSEDKYNDRAGLGKPCARERPLIMSVLCVSRGMMERVREPGSLSRFIQKPPTPWQRSDTMEAGRKVNYTSSLVWTCN